MRNLVVGFALVLGVGVLQWASAGPAAAEPPVAMTSVTASNELPGLLKRLGARTLLKVQAKECAQEGESCTSDEQCCSGLQCNGAPGASQAACAEAD